MGMRWIKMSRKMLQNLAYFRNKKTQVLVFFHFEQFWICYSKKMALVSIINHISSSKNMPNFEAFISTFSMGTNLDFSSYTLFKIVDKNLVGARTLQKLKSKFSDFFLYFSLQNKQCCFPKLQFFREIVRLTL